MRSPRRRAAAWAVGGACVAGVLLVLALAEPRENPAASCANCRHHLESMLELYTEEHDGWYPRGGATPLDSLVAAITSGQGGETVHLVTSHALAPRAEACYRETGRLTPDLSCYRYNPGLRADDPPGLVVVYYAWPTRWASRFRRVDEVGRAALLHRQRWTFLSEEDFAAAQERTRAALTGRAR